MPDFYLGGVSLVIFKDGDLRKAFNVWIGFMILGRTKQGGQIGVLFRRHGLIPKKQHFMRQEHLPQFCEFRFV